MLAELVVVVIGLSALMWISFTGGAAILFGSALYIGSKSAMIFFLNRNAPGLLRADIDLPRRGGQEQRWEGTAGKSVVPKWVSYANLTSMVIILAGLLISLISLTGLVA